MNSESLFVDLEAPLLARRLAWLLSLLLCLGVAVLIWMPWQQNVRGLGQVIAFSPLERRQEIEAPIKGRIKAWYVQEGSQVKKGDLIASIQDNDPEYVQRLERQRETLSHQLNFNQSKIMAYQLMTQNSETILQAALDSAQAKISATEAKVEQAKQDVSGLEAELHTSRLNLERETALQEKGLSSQRTYELATLKYQTNLAKLEKSRAKLTTVRSELKQAQADRNKAAAEARAKINSAQASLQDAHNSVEKSRAELLKLDTQLARQSTQEIRAPREGTILKLNTVSDTVYVKAGEKLATLVPDTRDRAVEVYLSGNDIPLVTQGQEVRLQFEGWPALQFSGWPSAAVGTFAGEVALVDVSDSKDGKFRIVVRPRHQDSGESDAWPEARFLRQGVRVKAWVLLDTVPLGYELWRQFNGFPPRMEQAAKTESVNPIKRKSKK